MKNLFYVLSLLLLSSCTEYWWTRGQPPSVKDLINRANLRFSESPKTRTDFLPIAEKLKDSLMSSVEAVTQNSSNKIEALKNTEMSFIELEGKLSIGSRAAYGELSNQMRSFINIAESQKNLDPSAYGLFASRTIYFLASELTVPAPTF